MLGAGGSQCYRRYEMLIWNIIKCLPLLIVCGWLVFVFYQIKVGQTLIMNLYSTWINDNVF